jgi:hypothetical protein
MKWCVAVAFLLQGCVTIGPDFSGVKEHCEDRGGSHPDVVNNPIYFTCADGSQWKRASHGEYDFQGWKDGK